MIDKQFKPLCYSKRYRVKSRLKYKDWESFKWCARRPNYPIMLRVWSNLHFLGSHSFVQERWIGAERKFLQKHPKIGY